MGQRFNFYIRFWRTSNQPRLIQCLLSFKRSKIKYFGWRPAWIRQNRRYPTPHRHNGNQVQPRTMHLAKCPTVRLKIHHIKLTRPFSRLLNILLGVVILPDVSLTGRARASIAKMDFNLYQGRVLFQSMILVRSCALFSPMRQMPRS